jgi:hypothetical protein
MLDVFGQMREYVYILSNGLMSNMDVLDALNRDVPQSLRERVREGMARHAFVYLKLFIITFCSTRHLRINHRQTLATISKSPSQTQPKTSQDSETCSRLLLYFTSWTKMLLAGEIYIYPR